tara:strand:+ start:912 stop:1331 length:420 start_codon:yes stop_codon:yes gene_type:complete
MHPTIMHWIGSLHRWLYVLTGGYVGGQFGSLKFLLLTTRGSQSGRLRTLPLLYLEDGENFLIPASSGGNPRNPAWVGNIKADSDVSVRVGSKVFLMKGILADEPDRTRFYERFVETMSHYAEYEKRSGRVIPVIILSKR